MLTFIMIFMAVYLGIALGVIGIALLMGYLFGRFTVKKMEVVVSIVLVAAALIAAIVIVYSNPALNGR